MEEALLSATVLDVGPAGFAGGRHVEAIAPRNELPLEISQPVARLAHLFHPRILPPAAMLLLLFLHQRRKRTFCEAAAHRRLSNPDLLPRGAIRMRRRLFRFTCRLRACH